MTTNWLSPNPFGSDLNWIVPPENQGQIIEVAYASDGDRLYRRTRNRSSGTVVTESVSWDDLDKPEGWYQPWNREPRVPEHLWQ